MKIIDVFNLIKKFVIINSKKRVKIYLRLNYEKKSYNRWRIWSGWSYLAELLIKKQYFVYGIVNK